MFLSQFPLTLLQTQKGLLLLIWQLMTVVLWIGMVFVIIFEMFHGIISLNSVLLQLLLNLWVFPGWNWRIYSLSYISSEASFISMVSVACASAITSGNYRISVPEVQVRGQFQGHKNCPNCLHPPPPPPRVNGEENLWFLYALKCPIPDLILPEKTWEGIKTFFFKIKVITYISVLLNLGAEVTAQ